MKDITISSAHKRESNKMFLIVAILSLLFFSNNVQAKEFVSDGLIYSTEGNNAAVTYYTSIPDGGAVTIPESVADPDDNSVVYTVTSIGNDAFSCYYGLTSVTIPNSVTSIGNYAFLNCSILTEINVESGNTAYSSEDGVLFDKAGTNLICYPAGKTGTTYIIPNSVTSIGTSAFSYCSGLRSVTIGNSVTSIGDLAFSLCDNLTEINVESGNATFASENGILFNKDKTTILLYPAGKAGTTYIIPNSVTSIGDRAFDSCRGLTSVTIGNSVTSIGEDAFLSCRGLTSVTIPNSVTSIGNNAFKGCSGLTSVTIGNSVTSIGEYAFYICSGLTSVTIGNSVTSIGEDAFRFCSNLTSVTIPEFVKIIDKFAFAGCSKATLYCETEESAILEKWNASWNKSGGTVKWGCKVIRAEADNIEYGSVTICGENNAAVGANGSLWYLNETTNGTATLTAAPTEGYHFVKWTSEGVDDITDIQITINVSASRTYTAVFESDAPTSVKSDVQSQINIFAVGKNIIVENADSEIFVTDMAGREVAREMPARRNVISVAASGIYVVKVGKTVKRVLVK